MRIIFMHIFFFKQKTAYEMRISDWSSDVCSSDLLDDQVVERLRLQARQHGHLRAALDLEHTDGIGALQHLVDGGILRRHRGDGEVAAVVLPHQLEALAQAGQHAERQHVDLQDAEIGRASCMERVCHYVSITDVSASLKQQTKQ